MLCNWCGKSFPDKFEKCPYCGAKKTPASERILAIKQNLNYLKSLKNYFEQAVSTIEKEVSNIEKAISFKPQPVIKKEPQQPIQRVERKEREPFIERFLGEKFLLTIGIIAVLFASAFFLKFSYENNLFNPIFRVMITTIAGIGFILTGYHLQSKNRIFGVILITTGIALLFFSNFASLVLYGFYGIPIAFAINLLLAGCSLFLAIRFESQWVSIIGIGGAYLTPLSLREALTNDLGFFSYLIALSIAPIFLALKKRWSGIVIVANGFTVMWFFVWYYSYFKSNSSINFIYTGIVFYLIFTLSAIFYLKKKGKSLFALSPLMAMFFYPLISVKAMDFSGIHLIAPSIIYIVSGIVIAVLSKLKTLNEGERVFLFTTGILTIFTGIYFNLTQISFTSFFSFALILSIYLFLLTDKKWILIMNLFLITFLFFKATVFDVFENLKFSLTHFSFKGYSNLSLRVMEYLAVISAMALNSKIAKRKKENWFYYIAGFFTGFAILGFLTCEATTLFYTLLRKGQSMAFSLAWVLYGATLFFIGLKSERKGFKLSAFLIFGVVLIKLFFIDIIAMSLLYRVLTFFTTGVVFIVSSYLYYKLERKSKNT